MMGRITSFPITIAVALALVEIAFVIEMRAIFQFIGQRDPIAFTGV
jgi:hypothetical protein